MMVWRIYPRIPETHHSIENWSKANPALKDASTKKAQRDLPPTVNRDHLQTLLSHCLCERDKALISLLRDSGMRTSEVMNVRCPHPHPISNHNRRCGTILSGRPTKIAGANPNIAPILS